MKFWVYWAWQAHPGCGAVVRYQLVTTAAEWMVPAIDQSIVSYVRRNYPKPPRTVPPAPGWDTTDEWTGVLRALWNATSNQYEEQKMVWSDWWGGR